MNKEYQTVGLYEHNIDSYNKIKKAYEDGEKVVGIVHATGTGKSYNALQLAYDNKDKRIVYVVPNNSIIEHIKEIINNNPNLDLERDFPNLEFRTYQSFVNCRSDEIENIDCDLLILDEFHHIGAPIWGSKINTLIETHPDIKVFGMTAYTVRDRGTAYERDMANSETGELFSNKIQSRYDICDAMMDEVLPKPIYKTAHTNLIGIEQKLEERVLKMDASSDEYREYMTILNDVKRRIHEAPSIPKLLKKNIKPNGKYIYFCSPYSEAGINDIETIKKQAMEWFKGFLPEEDIVFYTSTSSMEDHGKSNREAFYKNLDLDGENASNKLRIMFAINQYNEGVHAPEIDGVIMGRGTGSDIVYFEQLGRALSVRGDTYEMFNKLDKYSIEELIEMCNNRDIIVKENMSKENLIERLIAPVVIDLTNNYDFIKELENNLQDRIKEEQEKGDGHSKRRKLTDASFDIEVENQDIYETLLDVMSRLTMTWEDYYNLAVIYYEHYGDLEVPGLFKTNDGYTYDENGKIYLGKWIQRQKEAYKKNKLSEDRIKLLKQIEIRFGDKNDLRWNEMYGYAKIYYEYHGDLKVPYDFKTNDGYTYDENGKINLGRWNQNQRETYKKNKLSEDRIVLLQQIEMQFEDKNEFRWNMMYEYAKIYYEHYGDLEVPGLFKTNDGYTYDKNGKIYLGKWIQNQRETYKKNKLSEDRIVLLQQIEMQFEDKNEFRWNMMYEYAKIYYERHGDLEVPDGFKTSDGYTYDENGKINLGSWVERQRQLYKNNKLSEDRIKLLKQIKIRFENKVNILSWEEMYEYAKIYYEHYGNLEVPATFKTNDGYTRDDKNGEIYLGSWIRSQRIRYENNKLSEDKIKLLEHMGMRLEINKIIHFGWDKMYEYAKKYYEHFGDLRVAARFRTNDGYTSDKNGQIKLGSWIDTNRNAYKKNKLSEERVELLQQIGMIWDVRKNKSNLIELCNRYGIDIKKYKELLNKSYDELYVKICFLLDNNIVIISGDSLCDIFFMSDIDMQDKYGISLKELLDKYISRDKKGNK